MSKWQAWKHKGPLWILYKSKSWLGICRDLLWWRHIRHKKENRTGLLRLLADCENKKIDFIITKSVSRFARNTTDCIEMVRKLTDLGVFIYFEKENINTQRMEGELVLTILSSLAENESLSIAENSKWSIRRRFQNGTYKISYPPMVTIMWMESYLSIKNRLKS